ncbi:hypothetical protein [Micromonospora sp. NPDC004704]
MGEGDQVVKALLTALAALEDFVEGRHDSHGALSAIEGVAYELGEMTPVEHQGFLDALARVAAEEEPARAAWIQGIPGALGLAARS